FPYCKKHAAPWPLRRSGRPLAVRLCHRA
ncbi:unnamed protein product, partial [Caretta caretta]